HAHNQGNFPRNRFATRTRRARRRNVDDACVTACALLRLGHRVEHGQPEMTGAAFAWRCAADHFGAVSDRLLGMEGAVLAGEALADDLGVLVDEDGHRGCCASTARQGRCVNCTGEAAAQPPIRHRPTRFPNPALSFTAFTIFCAASSRSWAEVTLRLDFAMISLPNSTFVPSSRTTSGTRKPTSFTAATTPSAITSHFIMPPKMLTRMPCTLGSAVMILKAAATFSLLAPPPTSKKFAGASPANTLIFLDP